MSRKKKSTIPENAQVPVAIVMAVLFAIILAWRFWPKEDIPAATPEMLLLQAQPAAGDIQGDVFRLRGLLSSLRQDGLGASPKPPGERRLVRNPFSPTSWEQAQALLEEAASLYETLPPLEVAVFEAQDREERIAMLTLTATVLKHDFRMAMVNGQYVREGDLIDGFRVHAIKEKCILLRDKVGETMLSIVATPIYETVEAAEPEPAPEPQEIPES